MATNDFATGFVAGNGGEIGPNAVGTLDEVEISRVDRRGEHPHQDFAIKDFRLGYLSALSDFKRVTEDVELNLAHDEGII